jgi:hypothetical protein
MDMQQLKTIKTFSGLKNALKLHSIESVRELKYKSYFHVMIGDHGEDTFIIVDIYGGIFSAVNRKFNGKNYDLLDECAVYVKRQGTQPLIDFLVSHNGISHT